MTQRSISLPANLRFGAIDPKNHLVLATLDSDLVFADLQTGLVKLRLPAFGHSSQYKISPDGSRLVLAQSPRADGSSGELTVWNFKSGRRLLSLQHEGWLRTISFSPDGNRLLAAVAQPSQAVRPIQIWDATPPP